MLKTWIMILAVFIVAGVILSLIFIFSDKPANPVMDNFSDQTVSPTVMPSPTSASAPSLNLDPKIEYTAILNTTTGKITLRLNGSQTPVTVNNFIYLAKKAFYNNTVFHRVIKGFMIQGGDPSGNGTGGPGYTFADEPFTGEYTRGTLAMANAGPNTNGSQFFIMQNDNNLPKNYVIFGKVINGMDVVDKIADASVSAALSGEYSQPVVPVKILSVEILEKKLPSSSSSILDSN